MATMRQELARLRRDAERIVSGQEVAMRKAVNDVVRAAQRAELQTMRGAFDKLVPYTQRAIGAQFVGVRPDKAHKVEASVYVKARRDVRAGETRPESYLQPGIEGGGRSQKRFERALQRKGLLPAGWLTTPGRGAQLDAYGNIAGAQIVKLMAYLRLFGEEAKRQNASDKSLARTRRGTRGSKKNALGTFGREYFVVMPGKKGLHPGIWVRKRINSLFGVGKSGPEMVVAFVASARYRRRYAFGAPSRLIVDRQLPAYRAKRLTEMGL